MLWKLDSLRKELVREIKARLKSGWELNGILTFAAKGTESSFTIRDFDVGDYEGWAALSTWNDGYKESIDVDNLESLLSVDDLYEIYNRLERPE